MINSVANTLHFAFYVYQKELIFVRSKGNNKNDMNIHVEQKRMCHNVDTSSSVSRKFIY